MNKNRIRTRLHEYDRKMWKKEEVIEEDKEGKFYVLLATKKRKTRCMCILYFVCVLYV